MSSTNENASPPVGDVVQGGNEQGQLVISVHKDVNPAEDSIAETRDWLWERANAWLTENRAMAIPDSWRFRTFDREDGKIRVELEVPVTKPLPSASTLPTLMIKPGATGLETQVLYGTEGVAAVDITQALKSVTLHYDGDPNEDVMLTLVARAKVLTGDE